MRNQILIGDVREQLRRLPDGCVQCCVTSPPYWGLRDYGVEGQLGLEKTPEEYTSNMVEVFREVKRVLRGDGVCWLNLGDSYAASGNGGNPPGSEFTKQATNAGSVNGVHVEKPRVAPRGLKAKDLCGIPWRVAFALQADGWYLRQDIIWAKPNPMPESVRDRCTKSHEYVFLLSKSDRYFFDSMAIAEPLTRPEEADRKSPAVFGGRDKHQEAGKQSRLHSGNEYVGTSTGTRNKRSVWKYSAHSFKGAHFATFPPRLAETCIKAGSSEKGCCPTCGKPWVRTTEKVRVPTRPGTGSKVYVDPVNSPYEQHNGTIVGNRDPQRHCTATRTTGWQQSCKCELHEPVPCLILDPFMGAGTVGLMAAHLGRDYVGTEINPEYAAMAVERIEAGYQPQKSRQPGRKQYRRERLLFAMEDSANA